MALLDYTGAGARLTIEQALKLDARRWAVQEKRDGVYARISTDRRGRVFSVLSRAGKPLPEASDLIGILAGTPDSVLHGELEAHTESGNRIAGVRGYRCVHLFDATRIEGRNIEATAYSDRYAELHRMQAAIEMTPSGRINPWVVDDEGDHHDKRTGRYTKAVPRDLRRFPVLQLHRGPSAMEALWSSYVEREGGEGLVAVRLDAPVSARGAKRKVKATSEIDCTVIACDGKAATLSYAGHVFVVGCCGLLYRPGERVEVLHDGFYEASPTPRFPRIVRTRPDLSLIN